MTILTNENINTTLWMQLQKESPTASWFATEAAYLLFRASKECMEPFALAVEREGRYTGICVGYVSREGGALRNHFSRRAVIQGGPMLSKDIREDELHALLEAIKQEAEQLGAIYTEFRNFADYSAYRTTFEACGFAYQAHYDIRIPTGNAEQMWNNIAEPKQRQIRKAQSEGQHYEVLYSKHPEAEQQIAQWYTLLKDLYHSKVHRPVLPLSYFRRAIMEADCLLLLVKNKSEEIVGGAFMPLLRQNDHITLYEHYICGPVMSTFGAMDYASKNGIEVFDTMGAGSPETPYGVRDFKLQMGGNNSLKEYGRFIYLHRPTLYRLGSMVIKLRK